MGYAAVSGFKYARHSTAVAVLLYSLKYQVLVTIIRVVLVDGHDYKSGAVWVGFDPVSSMTAVPEYRVPQ